MNVSEISFNQEIVLDPATVLNFSGSGGSQKSTAKKMKMGGLKVKVIKMNDASIGIDALTPAGKAIRIPLKANADIDFTLGEEVVEEVVEEVKAEEVVVEEVVVEEAKPEVVEEVDAKDVVEVVETVDAIETKDETTKKEPKVRIRPTTAAVDPFNSLGNRVKTLDELREATPAVFATAPDGKVTEKYNFVATNKIVEDILSLGWELHSSKQNGPQDTARHMVRFTHPLMGNMKQVSGDNVKPQIILDNSHNRGSSAQFHMGLFRLVCTNGLVTAIPGMYNNVKFRHMGIDKEEIKLVLEKAAEQYMNIGDHVGNMREISMNRDEKEEFAIKAIAQREPHLFINEDKSINMKALTASTNPLDILSPIRGEDEANDLWTVFNVIQERMIKGGYQRIATNGRNSTTRGVSSASRNIDLNKKIWTIAETFMPTPEVAEVLEAETPIEIITL